MKCPNCGMLESLNKFPYARDGEDFECGSYVKPDGSFRQSKGCKEIARLRDMLLEALPYVQDAVSDLTYKHSARAKIAGLAKRIENEVRV